jgi:hypothetical protein
MKKNNNNEDESKVRVDSLVGTTVLREAPHPHVVPDRGKWIHGRNYKLAGGGRRDDFVACMYSDACSPGPASYHVPSEFAPSHRVKFNQKFDGRADEPPTSASALPPRHHTRSAAQAKKDRDAIYYGSRRRRAAKERQHAQNQPELYRSTGGGSGAMLSDRVLQHAITKGGGKSEMDLAQLIRDARGTF